MQMRLALGGSACNMSCSYCRAMHNLPEKNICAPIKEAQLNKEALLAQILPVKDKIDRVSIWGGEPFLDFERFKEAFEFVKEVLPDASVGVITNGTMLIHDHICDYVVENNIQLSLSHDAHNQSYRGIDYLKDERYVKNLSKLPYISVHSVLHRHNLDLVALQGYYKEIAEKNGWTIRWSYEMYKAVSPESYQFACRGNDFAKLRKAIDYAVREMVNGNEFFSSMRSAIEQVGFKADKNSIDGYRCGMNGNLILNHKGERMLCQVQSETDEQIKYQPGEIPERCEGCPVAKICIGYCPLIRDEYRKVNCSYINTYYDQLICTVNDLSEELNLKEY